MTFDELQTVQAGITKVVCREKHHNFDAGWVDDGMDNMVGLTLCVAKDPEGEYIRLSNPSNPFKTYSFHYTILDIVGNFDTEVFVDGVKFLSRDKVDINLLSGILLSQDYDVVKKLIKTKKHLTLDVQTIDKVTKQCPRVIGALISNKLLKRVNHEV